MATRRQLNGLAGFYLLALACPALAFDQPKGRPILTITGQIGTTNVGNQAQFDMAMLEALPQQSFTTQTPWFDQPVRFTGPLLADVLKAAKAQGNSIEATAINDYKIVIPMEDAARHPVIVARLLNGKPMTVREKGPLFVVYNFDHSPALRKSVYYERSIWQLKSLKVLP